MATATSVDLTLWWVGIGLIGILLLMGAVAWLRDWREERADRVQLAEVIRQVTQGIADERSERHGRHG